jgi:hypothetical protein
MERSVPKASVSRHRIEQLAARLGTLQSRVIFAGECALGFLLTNRGIAQLARPVRSNPVVAVVAYGSPDRLGAELRLLGLQPDRSLMPADSWQTPDGTRLELISPEGWTKIENPWYQFVLECTLQIQPKQGPAFRTAGAPAFLATHLFGIDTRHVEGTAPGWSSRMEDIVLLAIGRRELEREMAAAPPDVRAHVRDSLEPFLLGADALAFVYEFLPRAVRSPLAAQRVLGTLRRIAGLSSTGAETALGSGAYITALASPNPPK